MFLGKGGHSTFSGDCIFLGRPWGLRDDSSPSFSAALEVQAFVPGREKGSRTGKGVILLFLYVASSSGGVVADATQPPDTGSRCLRHRLDQKFAIHDREESMQWNPSE